MIKQVAIIISLLVQKHDVAVFNVKKKIKQEPRFAFLIDG